MLAFFIENLLLIVSLIIKYQQIDFNLFSNFDFYEKIKSKNQKIYNAIIMIEYFSLITI